MSLELFSMHGAFRFLEDLGCARTCPWVKSCLEHSEGYGFLLLVVWKSDSWFGQMTEGCRCGIKQINRPRRCRAAAGDVPLTFHVLKLSFSSFPWPAEPLSSAQGIMGKVCQFSRIWHLWVILSQGLFFKGPPERLAWGLMLTLTLTVWPILGLNCKHEWENPLEQANCPFLWSFSYWFTFLRWGPECCLELDGNFRN